METIQGVSQGYAVWGCKGTSIANTSAAIGTGAANTAKIVAACAGVSAAKVANDYSLNGYDDWYLPSQDELAELFKQKAVVGGLTNSVWWSSTQGTSNDAFAQSPGQAGGSIGKDNVYAVRVIRSF